MSEQKTKVLIFGGTTEGRVIAKILADGGVCAYLHTATEYGKDTAAQHGCDTGHISSGRLTASEMREFITENGFTHVVDATHPYAEKAAENIRAACRGASVSYMRLRRETDGNPCGDNVFYVKNAVEAIEILNRPAHSEDCVLLATGSKELSEFTRINNYGRRLFPRILPMKESLNTALELGYSASNIICMQGPFSVMMNVATLNAVNARWLVTKSSGDAGGFSEKLSAAEIAKASVIVIGEPCEKAEKCYDINETAEFFGVGAKRRSLSFTFFPLFVNMRGKRVIVIGGGKIAERRVVRLLAFGADITVISPERTQTLAELSESGKIKYVKREYAEGDASGAFLTVAATDDRAVNSAVAKEVNSQNGLVIVSDKREDCGCYFPAIAESADFIAGVVSKKGKHRQVKKIAEIIAKDIERTLDYD